MAAGRLKFIRLIQINVISLHGERHKSPPCGLDSGVCFFGGFRFMMISVVNFSDKLSIRHSLLLTGRIFRRRISSATVSNNGTRYAGLAAHPSPLQKPMETSSRARNGSCKIQLSKLQSYLRQTLTETTNRITSNRNVEFVR